jgi:hypothetical protein
MRPARSQDKHQRKQIMRTRSRHCRSSQAISFCRADSVGLAGFDLRPLDPESDIRRIPLSCKVSQSLPTSKERLWLSQRNALDLRQYVTTSRQRQRWILRGVGVIGAICRLAKMLHSPTSIYFGGSAAEARQVIVLGAPLFCLPTKVRTHGSSGRSSQASATTFCVERPSSTR